MDFSSHFKTLSQAYLIEGSRVAVEPELFYILENFHGVNSHNNPDVWKGNFHTFTIENAREIKELASKKKISDDKRVFVISADGITREASNALLKTLEEPGEDTHFFIIVPSIKRILPTILSRVQVVVHNGAHCGHRAEGGPFAVSSETFLTHSPAERLADVKEILAKLEKEEISKGDIASYIDNIIKHKHEDLKGQTSRTSLEKEALIASYNRDQSASLKMILEYLALTV